MLKLLFDLTISLFFLLYYLDLVPLAWSWDRLLPWMSGTVLFEDYFNYLEEYFRQNFANDSPSLNLQAAAAAVTFSASGELNFVL
jgi:hypothetical protein